MTKLLIVAHTVAIALGGLKQGPHPGQKQNKTTPKPNRPKGDNNDHYFWNMYYV